jgi:hypothetical protein
MINKIKTFNKLNSQQKRSEIKKLLYRLLNNFIFSFKPIFANLYISYKPDFYVSNQNKEFDILLTQFRNKNILNNSGDITRLFCLMLNIEQAFKEGVQGDFAEVGVYKGNTSAILAHYANKYNQKVLLYDTFCGFDIRDLQGVDSDKGGVDFSNTNIELVKTVIQNLQVCEFVQGWFPDSIKDEHYSLNYSIVSLDCDLYEPIKAGLDFFYPRMSKGGFLLIHDYSSGHWDGARKAVDEFCNSTKQQVILMPDKSGSAFIRKF